MKKVEMKVAAMAFAESCKLYLQDCKQRNLREATINHYRQSYAQFYRYFDADMSMEEFDAAMYNEYTFYEYSWKNGCSLSFMLYLLLFVANRRGGRVSS